MKIAILSDIHDHVDNLQKALAMPALQATDTLLCCGDLCSPFIIKLMAQGYPHPMNFVLGNNDGDVAAFIANANNFPHLTLHGEYFRGTIGGIDIAMNHYPDKAKMLAQQNTYDLVCHGHNHEVNQGGKIGRTLLVNPGTLMGFHGGTLKAIPATFLVFDTEDRTCELIEL